METKHEDSGNGREAQASAATVLSLDERTRTSDERGVNSRYDHVVAQIRLCLTHGNYASPLMMFQRSSTNTTAKCKKP